MELSRSPEHLGGQLVWATENIALREEDRSHISLEGELAIGPRASVIGLNTRVLQDSWVSRVSRQERQT